LGYIWARKLSFNSLLAKPQSDLGLIFLALQVWSFQDLNAFLHGLGHEENQIVKKKLTNFLLLFFSFLFFSFLFTVLF
jgi:hypothetical protein